MEEYPTLKVLYPPQGIDIDTLSVKITDGAYVTPEVWAQEWIDTGKYVALCCVVCHWVGISHMSAHHVPQCPDGCTLTPSYILP